MKACAFPVYVSVVADVAIDQTLDYGVPPELVDKVTRGSRVQIPIRGVQRSGYVIAIKPDSQLRSVKPISAVLTTETPLTDDLFSLALWMARYYCAPLGEVLKTILPAGIRGKSREKLQLYVTRTKTLDELTQLCAELRRSSPAQAAVLDVMLKVTKGILLTELLEKAQVTQAPVKSLEKKGALHMGAVRVDRSPLVDEEYLTTRAKKLHQEQKAALEKINNGLTLARFETHLLHGITGSGKTEIYIQAIDHALRLGKGAIVLVPEISLTPQTIERFRSRFQDRIAVLHHRLSDGERFDEWHRIVRGDARIVIGARSAVFSPVPKLGILIVDEEHENSYKQSERAPCYHARDLAVVRGKLANCAVVLGSATPSIESYQNALCGKYHLSTLKVRADAAKIPQVQIVNMKDEYDKQGGYTNFSASLLKGIDERHKIGEQTLLFLNRRGFHTSLLCPHCSQVVRCPHCDVALTFHKEEQQLMCHLCAYIIKPPPRKCPNCKSTDPMRFRGSGTEQIQKALHAILPDIRTIRIDADTTRHKGSHQKLLREFGTGKADVLVGTQMIAKGLHFPQVTLVGILNSDSSLNIPDFRASETTYQLITQVAGRAGRGHSPGEVIIQTLMPDNPTIQLAAKGDYTGFIQEELKSREVFQYPPFAQLAKLLFTGWEADLVQESAHRFRTALQQKLTDAFDLHPVLPAGHAKIKDRYRFQFLVRGPKGYLLSQHLEEVQKEVVLNRKVRLLIDVNPISTYF